MDNEIIDSLAKKIRDGYRQGFFRKPTSSTTNPWTFFDVDRSHELVLSKALAWIMTPTEGHGIGDFFLNKLLHLISSVDQEPQLPINPAKTVVAVEPSRLDILVESEPDSNDEPTSVIVIENKHLAGETRRAADGLSQLARYPDKVRLRYRNRDVRIKYIYLTLDGRSPEDEADERTKVWVPVAYSDVVKILDETVSIATTEAGKKAISDFGEHLRELLRRHTWKARSYIRNDFLSLSDSKSSSSNDHLSIVLALVEHLNIARVDECTRLKQVLQEGHAGYFADTRSISDPEEIWNRLTRCIGEDSSLLANEQLLRDALDHVWEVISKLSGSPLDFRFTRSVEKRRANGVISKGTAESLLLLEKDFQRLQVGSYKIRPGLQDGDGSWTVQLYDSVLNQKIARIGRIVAKDDVLKIYFQDSKRFHQKINYEIRENIEFFKASGTLNEFATSPKDTGLLNVSVNSADFDLDLLQHVAQTFTKIVKLRALATKKIRVN